MRSKVFIVVVALVLGGIAAVLAAGYLRSARTELASQNEPVEVLVAQQALPRGLSAAELVERDLVKVEKVPAQFVAADAVSSERVIADQVLATAVSAGEQLTRSRFEYPSEAGLSYSVPEGLVAVSFNVDQASGVAGLLKAGDNVIVYQSYQQQGGGEPFTVTAIPKARVLAAGQNTSAAPPEQDTKDGGLGATEDKTTTEYQTVTLALTPAQAESVVFAETVGKLHLALLSPNAEAPAQTAPTTYRTVTSVAGLKGLQ